MVEPSQRIFLAHAKEDEKAVIQLYERLKQAGYSPWLDKKDLLAGQRWRDEIPKAIKQSSIFIACLSQNSIEKRGYVQQEFRLALMECAQRPASKIFLIPFRLDNCEIPNLSHAEYGVSLNDYHWLDYFEADGFARLVASIQHAGIQSQLPPEELSTPVQARSQSEPPPQPEAQLYWYYKELLDKEAEQQLAALLTFQGPKSFQEQLPNGVLLDMLYIPGGSFLMGSPEDEEGRGDSEGPQHRVTVPAFYMCKYPVTHVQWRAITVLPRIAKELDLNPSFFKSGDNRPVEQVSWDDAVEFCKRLSRHVGKKYRLPSESEWEYACRAQTITPFNFGETISTEQVNYHGGYTYGNGKRGQYRRRTTAVGIFSPNTFGLYDMHGNVFEWCEDVWHDSYKGAPDDGSAWTEGEGSGQHVMRGGAWYSPPRDCRSAYRNSNSEVDGIGFRVCCSVPTT